MTTREMSIKLVCVKHIIEDMAKDSFWRLIITSKERLFEAVERAMNRLKVPDGEMTDEVLSDLIFRWTLPVRAEVGAEFGLIGAESQAGE